MCRLQTKDIYKVLLWILPIIYEVWYMVLDTFQREIRILDEEDNIMKGNKVMDILIDIMIFFRSFHILYFYLYYIVIISNLRIKQKMITTIFITFQIVSLISINYVYNQSQTFWGIGQSILYFIPYYIIVYILTKRSNG